MCAGDPKVAVGEDPQTPAPLSWACELTGPVGVELGVGQQRARADRDLNYTTKVSNTRAAASPLSTASAKADRSPLKCQAQATSQQPRDYTTVTIKVRTVALAEVTATSRRAPLKNRHVTAAR